MTLGGCYCVLWYSSAGMPAEVIIRESGSSSCCCAGRKRPAEQEGPAAGGAAPGGGGVGGGNGGPLPDHKAVLQGQRWKLQRVRSLGSLPTDDALLALAAMLPGVHETHPESE